MPGGAQAFGNRGARTAGGHGGNRGFGGNKGVYHRYLYLYNQGTFADQGI